MSDLKPQTFDVWRFRMSGAGEHDTRLGWVRSVVQGLVTIYIAPSNSKEPLVSFRCSLKHLVLVELVEQDVLYSRALTLLGVVDKLYMPFRQIAAAEPEVMGKPIPIEVLALTPEEVDAVVEALPGGVAGMYKTWGYQQLATAISNKLLEKLRRLHQ